jgi:uncharacterized protein YkwD
MRKSIRPARLALVLLLIVLTQPVHGARATGLRRSHHQTPAVLTSRPSAQKLTDGYTYTVQPADTLWDIAVANGITIEALIAANDLADPRLLRPGQTIYIPAQPPATSQHLPDKVSEAARTAVQSPEAAPMPQTTAEQMAAALALPPEIADWPAAILALVNEKRGVQGLPALAWSPELARAAQAHASDCARHNRGSHVGSDGARLRARLAKVGYEPRFASENWAHARSAQQAFNMWWEEPPGSDPHRRNILDPNYAEFGIGIAAGSWGYFFVADFGAR